MLPMFLLVGQGSPTAVVPPTTTTVVQVVYSRGTVSPGESETSICNLALSHLGVSTAISGLDERSTAARACNLWYTRCRDELLRSFIWPFAVTTADLSLVNYTPNGPEWTYNYTAPSDVLALLRSPYGSTRNPTLDTLTRWRVERNPLGGQFLYMDQQAATIEYIARITDPEEFPVDFVIALSYLIASRICASVVSENASQRTITMLGLYKEACGQAKMHAANEQVVDIPRESDFILSRY